jgi:hypothetical protein
VNGKEGELMLDSGKQVVQLADGTEHRVKRGVVNAAMKWDGWNGTVTLLVLPLQQYDVILGMTWLRKYNPYINWQTGSCVAKLNAVLTEPQTNNEHNQNRKDRLIEENERKRRTIEKGVKQRT